MNLTLKQKVVILLSGLLGICLFWKGCQTGKNLKPQTPVILPKDDKEQIIVDPVKHQLIIVQPGHTTVTTLPDRKSVVDIRKDGSVVVTSPQFGFETLPFVGFGFGSGIRGYAGADLMYFKRLDLGLGAVTPNLGKPEWTDTRAGVFVSYTVYDNTRMTVGYDTSKTVHALISVRL